MSKVKYNVPFELQQSSPVCWLACATMLLEFKHRQSLPAEVLGMSVNNDFRGQTVPSYGNREWGYMERLGLTNAHIADLHLSNTSEASVSSRRNMPTMLYHPGRQQEQRLRNFEGTMLQQLRQYGPFILHHFCGSFWYGPGVHVPVTGAHSVLIVGIDTINHNIWFNNPWGPPVVTTTTLSIMGAIDRWEQITSSPTISYLA